MGQTHRDVKRAHALQAQGTEKFRAGLPAQARGRFEQARRIFADHLGTDAPQTLEALSDFGAASAALGEHEAALMAHAAVLEARRRLLGPTDQRLGTSLHNLGVALRAQGRLAEAQACHLEGLAIWRSTLGEAHPILGKSFGALGMIARARGDAPAALHFAQQALALLPDADPQRAVAYDDLAGAFMLAGDERAALQAWDAALAVLRGRFGADTPRAGPVLTNMGIASRALDDLQGARGWFEAALSVAPGLSMARHHLAACLARLGEAEAARAQRERALVQQSVFVQKATGTERCRVLIPSVSDDGNVPLEHILPERDFTRIWWFPGQAEAGALPAFDVVFNGIGDADMEGAAAPALRDFIAGCAVKTFNPPGRIARTRRDVLPETLACIAGLVVPPVRRLGAGPVRFADMQVPALLRPIGSHGGVGLRRIDSWEGFDVQALSSAASWYVSPYVESRGTDGFYRKYRMVFVDRVPYAYHLAISHDWLVHYYTADMEAHAWKLAEEAAFLADPRAALGARAHDAVIAVGLSLDLDFCGIDFTILPDGRALVFEANATMLVHPESDTGKLAFKNPAVQKITKAVTHLVLER